MPAMYQTVDAWSLVLKSQSYRYKATFISCSFLVFQSPRTVTLASFPGGHAVSRFQLRGLKPTVCTSRGLLRTYADFRFHFHYTIGIAGMAFTPVFRTRTPLAERYAPLPRPPLFGLSGGEARGAEVAPRVLPTPAASVLTSSVAIISPYQVLINR